MHALLAAALASPAMLTGAPPQPPPLIHSRTPLSKTVTTAYTCADGVRTFSVRYDGNSDPVFVSGVRKDVSLPVFVLERASKALASMDALQAIVPECLEQADTLIVFGRVQERMSFIALIWSGNDLVPSQPQQLGEPEDSD